MSGKFPTARRTAASTLALVAAFAIGMTGTVAAAQSAKSKGKPQAQGKIANSPGFAKVYAPMAAIVNAPTGDFAALKPQVPGLLAAIVNQDDRFLAGNLVLILGNKTTDAVLQRQGLELMVASGKVAPDKLGQLQFLIGNLAYQANDIPAARAGLLAAQAAGYQDDNIGPVLAETYFKQQQYAEGLQSLKGSIMARRTAGGAVSDSWLRRGLEIAYRNKLQPQTNDWSALLVATNPTPANWNTALQVVNSANSFDPAVQLDLLRLMAITDALKEKRDYVGYIEAADPRIMSNEVAGVLQRAVAAGIMKPGDVYYNEVKKVVDTRMATDRADAPKMMVDARAAASGTSALNAGDVQYSLAHYADAEQMYQLALTKGSIDTNKALTRLGIAQAQQGKTADAKATFAKITGVRTPVAQMWLAYLATKA